jgi:hypothetical protein
MSTKTYDPGLVVVSIGGNIISGFADGTFINVERTSDSFSKQVGADGEVTRVRNRDRSGSITLTLMSSSLSNDILTALHKLDELSGTGVVPFLLKDLAGTTLVSAQSCWIRKPANVEFGKELSNREWTLDANPIDMTVGGNA